jgi:uncharacterized protein YgiM (DUF1202 family)/peptidoglycan/xylan/chitin deacetylase (PgdA/CDA1 family)
MSRSSLSFFLLIVSFGILFAGCGAPEPEKSFEEFTFSDTDLERVAEMASTGSVASSSSGTDYTVLSVTGTASTVTTTVGTVSSMGTVEPNKEKQAQYDALRTVVVDEGGNIYRVNNPYLNVRQSMSVSSPQVARLIAGDIVTVLEIPTAEWAKVKLMNSEEGYVSFRYLAKLTTESKLSEEKKQFDGKYYVDFQFLNIRKEPSTQAEKVGELPGQAIIKPLSMNGEWARVAYEGKEGYVSTQYLKPFLPVFLVRQDDYKLPILHYYADDTASINALSTQVAALKAAGKKIVTLKSLYDTVLAQETKDARINPGTVVIVISGVNAQNVRAVGDALNNAGAVATLFVLTKDVGVAGITEKAMLNLMANGNEIQSGGHTGDDLRSMTDSQVSLELGQSKKLIEDITKREVYVFDYPKGGVNDRIMKQAQEMGYLFGISQSPDSKFTRAQFLRLPTLMVSSGMSAEDVVKLTN